MKKFKVVLHVFIAMLFFGCATNDTSTIANSYAYANNPDSNPIKPSHGFTNDYIGATALFSLIGVIGQVNSANQERAEDRYKNNGYDKNGYDRFGFSKNNIHRDTGTRFDLNGYDKDGYDKDRLNKGGYDKDGYDKDGYDFYKIDRNGNKKAE